MSTSILLVSVIVQFAAASVAFRLVFVSGRGWAWCPIALALALMGLRRAVTLYRIVVGDTTLPPDLTAELIALSISILMFIGVLFIRPLFMSTQSRREELRKLTKAKNLNARLGRIVEQSLNEIYIFNAETLNFIQVNHGARTNLGYTLEELKKLTPLDIKPTFTPQKFEKLIKPLRDNSENIIVFQTTHSRKDNSTYDVEIHLQLVQTENPAVFVAIIRDISKHIQAEAALNKALTEAEEANQAKSEFLATMSHEFRTPLNAILGFSEIMRAQYFGPLGSEKYSEYLNDIYASGEQMLALVNDILYIAAIEAGQPSLDKEAIVIDQLINGTLKYFEIAANDAGIHLSTDIPENLPTIYANKRSLIQIIQNLLSNAMKFTNSDGTITITVSEEGSSISIKVADTGIGISPDLLPKVTEPFTQSDSNPYRAQKGTGLGLSIVKSLVELHNGAMNIESEKGEGTTVTVRLPL